MSRSIRLLALALVTSGFLVVGGALPSAAVECPSVRDTCHPVPTVPTPLGRAEITVSPTNVVTVRLFPTDPVRVTALGLAFLPPSPIVPPNPILEASRATQPTSAGTVVIDSYLVPAASRGVALVSLQFPTDPIRVRTQGLTVTFTPR